jgi:N-acetyl-gamma-glutamyl-phosphate reductase
VVFFATPHGVAMAQAPELLAAGVKVIDLAADFRLKDRAAFEKWYKIDHTPARTCWKKPCTACRN